MKIVELSENKYLECQDKFHAKINCHLDSDPSSKKRIVALIDNTDDIKSIAVIQEKTIYNKYRRGTILGSILTDYEDEENFKVFITLLSKYLKRRNYIYLTIQDNYPYKIYDKNQNLISLNTNILKLFDEASLLKVSLNSTKIATLSTDKTLEEVYHDLNSNTKRNIKLSLERSITISKCNDINLISYLKDKELEELTKTINNQSKEIYIAKLNTSTYLNNYYYLLNKEQEKKEQLNNKILSPNIKTTKSLINKKIISDKLITKYNREINRAITICNKYPKEVILSSIVIAKDNGTIYFQNQTYNKELKYLSSSHLLIWEIIKKYLTEGYHNFNFGKVTNKGDAFFKIGFNAILTESIGTYDLIIDKSKYQITKLYQKMVRN